MLPLSSCQVCGCICPFDHREVYVRKRPGVDEFLNAVAKLYEAVSLTVLVLLHKAVQLCFPCALLSARLQFLQLPLHSMRPAASSSVCKWEATVLWCTTELRSENSLLDVLDKSGWIQHR